MLEDSAQITFVFVESLTENKNVIEVGETKLEISQYLIHGSLKCLRGVREAERHPHINKPDGVTMAVLGMSPGSMGI